MPQASWKVDNICPFRLPFLTFLEWQVITQINLGRSLSAKSWQWIYLKICSWWSHRRPNIRCLKRLTPLLFWWYCFHTLMICLTYFQRPWTLYNVKKGSYQVSFWINMIVCKGYQWDLKQPSKLALKDIKCWWSASIIQYAINHSITLVWRQWSHILGQMSNDNVMNVLNISKLAVRKELYYTLLLNMDNSFSTHFWFFDTLKR